MSNDNIKKISKVGLVQICIRPSLHEMSREELEEVHSHAQKRGIQIEVGTSGSDPKQLLADLEIAKILEA